MSRKILGLDIRRDAVSAVVVKSGMSGSWIESYARVSFSVKEASFEEELKRSLESISGQIDIAHAVCVVALPAVDVTYRNLKAPFKEIKKVRQVLPFELETDLPYQVEDIVFDFNLLDNPLEPDTPQLFAAAIEKQRIAVLLDLLNSFKIEPDILTIGGYAMGQYLSRLSGKKHCHMFLDIGDSYTTMVLSLSGDVGLVRTFSIAGSDKSMLRSICSRINRTLLAFEQNSGVTCDLDELQITGSYLAAADVGPDLEAFFGVPVTRADLMEASGKIVLTSQEKTWEPYLMDGALSLVLNELSGFGSINFRRDRMGVGKAWVENKRDILKTCCLGGVVALLFLGYSIVNYYTLKQRVETKHTEILEIFQTTFPEVTQIVDPVHQMRVKLEALGKGASQPGEFAASVKTIDILNDISRLIPEKQDVELVSIIVGSDSVVVSGNTDTFNAVDDMKSGLEKAEIFNSVSISSANMDKSGTRVRFKLKVAL
ncbi:MAG: type II secretion system protein GspL [Desulfobacterales bacterium]|nr:type II secretion system protein GspL [Desulfobacterales bacterium]MDX2510598.1 type II secretion system protein GspL [Desulfobacterales bacterium]